MKLINTSLLLAMLLQGGVNTQVHAVQDPRFQKISEGELKKQINRTPLGSLEHPRLIARAQVSHLSRLAYEQYTFIWKKNQKDAYANLLRGVAAEEYWWQASFPQNKIRLTAKQDTELFQVAKKCIAESVKLKPDLPRANTAYGMFLWKHLGSVSSKEGVALIRKAIRLAPENARAHAALGEAYTTPTIPTYNPKEAEKELLKAIELDSTYSYPHYVLIRLYVDMKQFQKARKSLEAYKSLVPKEFGDRTAKFFDPIIVKGLAAAKP